ncbi:hypothetical protein FEM48_Zijuj08G0052600 [Ziziphus jujuba var. spinosa]|uniref:S-adenosyl-L-methionine-dependent methyltransferase n=1 Tax=Ziziphus jujuba var. spinosa TaxID=714518 RepID=A0A978UX69_ZIZJJ|nr:hypothetical protein FEM48_Zijuj08G0052600 [Ziziphus jujuba var. spinosa]
MAGWSAENATKAFLRALKMGKVGKEPDVGEFISAIAAGNNAQLMVMVCAGIAGSTTALALVAAAHQTGGRVVCILPRPDGLQASKIALGNYSNSVEFVTGEAKTLLLDDYKEADFVLIDCNIDHPKEVFQAAKKSSELDGGLVVGYNALHRESNWQSDHELKAHFLPIGEGLLVTRTCKRHGGGGNRRGHWVVKIDKCTGEEHVFRIRDPQRKWIEA